LAQAEEVRKKRHASFIFRVVVAGGAILWVFHGQDWGELARVFLRLDPWYFALSLAVFILAQVIIAVRWWLLLRAQAIHIAVTTAVRLFFLGLFYNNVMPGSVGGDLLKAWYVTKHTEKRLAGALSVFVDRLIGLFGLVVMAIFTWALFVRGELRAAAEVEPADGENWLSRNAGTLRWVGLAGAVVVFLVLMHPHTRARLKLAASRGWARAVGLLRETREAIVLYCSRPWTLVWALILTFIAQSMVIVAFWLLGRNLTIEAGLQHYFVIFPVMWVIAAVPVSIAGLGILEAGTVEMFTFLTGAAASKVLALAFCQRFVWVLASLPGGLIHLLGAHLPREISVDAAERLN